MTASRPALLVAGSIGMGHVALAGSCATVLQAHGAGLQVLAVADRNQRLARKLAALETSQPRVHAFGSTDRIADLMSAADLVITSSGDTCTAARTVGRPLLLLDVVHGHGRDNLQHELELGDAMVTSADTTDLTRSALAALDRIKLGRRIRPGHRARGRLPSARHWPASGCSTRRAPGRHP